MPEALAVPLGPALAGLDVGEGDESRCRPRPRSPASRSPASRSPPTLRQEWASFPPPTSSWDEDEQQHRDHAAGRTASPPLGLAIKEPAAAWSGAVISNPAPRPALPKGASGGEADPDLRRLESLGRWRIHDGDDDDGDDDDGDEQSMLSWHYGAARQNTEEEACCFVSATDPAGLLSACLSSHSTSGGSSPSASPLMPPTSRLFPPPFPPPSFSSAFAHLPPSPSSSSASPNHTCLRRTTSRSFISTTTTTTTTTVLGGGHHAGLASPRSSGTAAAAPDHEPDAANAHRRNRHLHRRSEDLSGIHGYSSFAAVQPQPRARSISSASQHPRILPLLSPRHPRDVRADDGALDAQTPAPTPQHHDDALPQPSSTATPSVARRRTPSRSAPSSRINLAKHFRHDDGTEASSSSSSSSGSGSGVGGFFGLVRERVNHLQSLHDPYDQAAASASSPTNPSFLPLLRSTTPDPGGSRLPPDLLSSTTDVTSTPETQQALTLLPPTLSSYLLAPVVPLVQALTLVCISLLAFSAVSAVLAGSYGLTAYDRARVRLKGVSLGLEGGRRLLERGVERGRKLVEGVVVGGTAGGGEAAATAKDGEDPALSSSSSSPRRHHRRWTTSSSSWSANLAWSSPPRPAATSSSSSPSYPPSPSFSQSAADYVRSALPGFFVADMGGGSPSSFSFREQPRRHFTQAQHQPQQPYPSRRAFTAPPSSTASSRAHSPTRFSPSSSSSSSFPPNSSSSSGAASSSSAPHYPPKPNGLPPRPPLSLLVPSILFTLFVSACAIGVAVVKAWRGELDAQRRGAREKEKPTAEAGTSTGSGRRRPTMTTAEKRRGW